jgi:hypothetical protein
MERRGPGSIGYVVVLLGVVAFVVGCFLPYMSSRGSGAGSVSLSRLYTLSLGGRGTSLGGVLVLFAGTATVGWIAIMGLRGSEDWTRRALAAVVVAWSLTWFGALLNHSQFGAPRVAGYWVILLSVLVVLIGTILVWMPARGEVPAEESEAPAS